jgi:hypothetical protein
MTPVTQAEISKAAWGACDTFRGVVDPSVTKKRIDRWIVEQEEKRGE